MSDKYAGIDVTGCDAEILKVLKDQEDQSSALRGRFKEIDGRLQSSIAASDLP